MNKNGFLDTLKRSLNSVTSSGRGWFPIIKESYAGAWQQNVELSKEDILGYHAIYACITLIAGDISKLGVNLVRRDENGIWIKTDNPAYSPVLRKPNGFQTRTQFYENWVLSTLTTGNAYILKQRDNRKVVTALYVLDPCRVQVMVADDGSVFYDLSPDSLTGVTGETVRVPSSEIIHDRMNCFYHPLVGISPIYACALSVTQGREIQNQASSFFRNGSRPGGILTAPGAVSDETVEQLRTYWEANYTGNNAGKVAVLADGLTYKSFETMTAQNSQVIEQLKWTAEVVASVFHIPAYMIGVGDTPAYNNIQALNQQYYAQALQKRIEDIEILLDEGLGMASDIGVEFNIDDLLRMDTKTLIESEELGTKSGIKKLNEARRRLNLPPMEGGDTAYLQVQNYSVSALAKRDAKDDPFAKEATAPTGEKELEDEELHYTIHEATHAVFRKHIL